MAKALGKYHEEDYYSSLFQQIKSAFNKAYVNPDGSMLGDSQGGYSLALAYDLIDEPTKSKTVSKLIAAIERNNGHPTIGYWSVDALLQALSENGQFETAETMMNLTSVPSWGHMVEGDSTTMWESFDASTRDSLNSLNHWPHSSVGEWLWRHIAGINPDPDQPGWKSVIICPRLCSTVDFCHASYDSLYGPITVDWSREPGQFTLNVTIPENSSATIFVPGRDSANITESGHPASASNGVKFMRQEGDSTLFHVESGSYSFRSILT
jgi:hypothetical protein